MHGAKFIKIKIFPIKVANGGGGEANGTERNQRNMPITYLENICLERCARFALERIILFFLSLFFFSLLFGGKSERVEALNFHVGERPDRAAGERLELAKKQRPR